MPGKNEGAKPTEFQAQMRAAKGRRQRDQLQRFCELSSPAAAQAHLTGSMRPSRLRVPSGKMCTQSPAAKRDCAEETAGEQGRV